METRVTRLEEQMAGVARDVREIRDSLKVLADLPTNATSTAGGLNGSRSAWASSL